MRGELARASEAHTTLLCSLAAFAGPGADQLAFELGQSTVVSGQAAHSGCPVAALGWPRVSQYVRIARGVAGNVSSAGQIADFTADFRSLLGVLGGGQRKRAATLPKRQRRRRSPVASVSSDMRSLSPSRNHRIGRSAARYTAPCA